MALGDSRTVLGEHCLLRADSSSIGKRKTPAELRAEQLKRTRTADGGSSQRPSIEVPALSRFTDTRAPDGLPSTKPAKPKFSLSKFKDLQFYRELDVGTKNLQTSTSLPPVPEPPNQEPSKSKFKNVAELSSRIQHQQSSIIDMAQAIKGLGVKKDVLVTRSASAPAKVLNAEINKLPATEFSYVPLDLSLKTSARFLSSRPFHWCHRIGVRDRFQGLKQFIEAGLQKDNGLLNQEEADAGLFWKGLHCWMHPHLALSTDAMSTLAGSAGQKGENAILLQMQRDWEDSLHSLYYAFRDKLCDMFYFCAQQFVVLFIGGGVAGRPSDGAYITRSSRRLRSILQQQDINFSMPLCKAGSPSATKEELQELSEFEKLHPGQTRLVDSLAGVDNSIQSLLAIEGNLNLHRLFDFLLNYRHVMGAMTILPTLCSPVPFQNASLKVPEVCSKQMQVAADDAITMQASYTLEIKGPLLAPWVMSRVCLAIEKLHKDESFEVSFVTEPLTEGINVAQGKDDAETSGPSSYGQPSDLGPSVIKQLKRTKGVYQATL